MTDARSRRRQWLVLAGVAAVGVVLAGIAWRTSSPIGTSEPPADEVREVATCEVSGAPDVCLDITLSDGRLARYALKGDPTASDTVVVDVGGPGLSLFASHWPQGFLTSVEPLLAGYRVILLEEPWVTAKYEDECRAELTGQYRWARGEDVRPPRVTEACELGSGVFGWTEDSYRATVEAITSHHDLNLVGFLGVSFGSHRYTHIDDKVEWAVLTNPAAAGFTLAAYLDGRATAVETVMRESCSSECSDLGLLLEAAEKSATTVSIDGRSAPVTASDLGAAALAVPYQDQETRTVLTDAILTGDSPALVGEASDGVWGRYGQWSISPRHAAYLEEICAAYPGGLIEGDAVVARALAGLHAPCADAGFTSVPEPPTAPAGGLCVSHLTDDPVTPPEFARSWDAVATATVRLEGSDHSALTGMERCLERLGALRAETTLSAP